MLTLLFGNKNTLWCVTSLITQQLIVAISTVLIIHLGSAIANHAFPVDTLILFVSSLFIVYIPGITSLIYLEKSKFTAINQYILKFCEKVSGRASLYNNTRYRHEQEPWLTNEGNLVIGETSVLAYNWLSTFLNAFLNILVIGAAISSWLIAAYLISFSLLLLCLHFSKNHIQTTASEFQTNRNKMNQSLLSGWDNILISNKYNLAFWKKLFSQNWQEAQKSAVKYEYITNLTSSIAMALALLPIAIVTILFFYINHNNYGALAALIVTLPRQIQIIQNIFAVFSHAVAWTGIKTKLAGLAASLDLPSQQEAIDSKITWQHLSFNEESALPHFDSIDSLLKHIDTKKSGRITLRGPNGAGKSVLLSLIKERMGERAIFIPINSRLSFSSTEHSSLSQGEKMKYAIEEISHTILPGSLLLLDEWDANLDQNNIAIISAKLAALSETITLIEVRHRNPPAI